MTAVEKSLDTKAAIDAGAFRHHNIALMQEEFEWLSENRSALRSNCS